MNYAISRGPVVAKSGQCRLHVAASESTDSDPPVVSEIRFLFLKFRLRLLSEHDTRDQRRANHHEFLSLILTPNQGFANPPTNPESYIPISTIASLH